MRKNILLVVLILAIALSIRVSGPSLAVTGSGTLYPWPTFWSPGDVASWSQPLIASGAALPSVGSASVGDLFLKFDAASGTLYRHSGTAWVPAGGGAGGGGTDHSALTKLDYANAGHTGFADATSTNAIAASLTAHLASSTDPHGATETITSSLIVGSGTADTDIYRAGTGTVGIASYVAIPEVTATPTSLATGVMTLWNDPNTGKLRVRDGSGTWHNLW